MILYSIHELLDDFEDSAQCIYTINLLKNSQAVKKWYGLKKSLGEKSWEIKGSGQEWLQ